MYDAGDTLIHRVLFNFCIANQLTEIFHNLLVNLNFSQFSQLIQSSTYHNTEHDQQMKIRQLIVRRNKQKGLKSQICMSATDACNGRKKYS